MGGGADCGGGGGGVASVGHDWPSCYWLPVHKTFLVVYVDDFKMSGPEDGLKRPWDMLRQKIDMEEPERIDSEGKGFIECRRKVSDVTLKDGTTARTMEYDKRELFQQCVEMYCESTDTHAPRSLKPRSQQLR